MKKCKTCRSFRINEDVHTHSGCYHSYSREVSFGCHNRKAMEDRDYLCLKNNEIKKGVICGEYKRSILRMIYHAWKLFWVSEYEIRRDQRSD